MKNVTLSLLAVTAVGVMSISSVKALPANNLAGLGESHLQDVRLVCDRFGRCHNTRKAYARRYRRSYGYYGQADIGAFQPGDAVQPGVDEVPTPGIAAFSGG